MRKHSDTAGFVAECDALEGGDYSYSPSSYSQAVSYSERSVWCSVIQQAFLDACPQYFSAKGDGSFPEKRCTRAKEQHEAIQWLLHDRLDFPYVCGLAGVAPSIMRNAARHLLVTHGHTLETTAGATDVRAQE